MRLYELTDFNPKQSHIDRQAYSNRVARGASPKKVGSGYFARVSKFDSPKRLNQVTKAGVAGKIGDDSPEIATEIEQDGYLSYLKMVQEDDSQNPYFPRIHDLKIRKKPQTGELSYTANLEKLRPFDEIYDNPELLKAIKAHIFGDDESLDQYQFSRLLVRACESKRGIIKDPQLLDAVEKIGQVAYDGGHSWDLSANNMMWRVTGTMPQLVITDPLA